MPVIWYSISVPSIRVRETFVGSSTVGAQRGGFLTQSDDRQVGTVCDRVAVHFKFPWRTPVGNLNATDVHDGHAISSFP